MNPRFLTGMGVTAAAAAAVLCWYLLSREPDSAPRRAGKGLAPAARVAGNRAAPAPVEPTPGTAAPQPGPQWLDSRGRDAAGLIAAWDMARDDALLLEAAKKFPGDPLVCSAMIQHAGTNFREAMPWIERLIAAEPDNPEGLYHKAWALIAGNDRAGAIEALRQAGTLPGPRNTHLPDRMLAVRDAATAGAATRGDAARQALAVLGQRRSSDPGSYSPLFESAPEARGGIPAALTQELAAAKSAGNEARRMEIIGIGISTAEQHSSGGAVSQWEELNARSLAFTLLVGLPDDTVVGDRGRTAGSIRAEVQGLNQERRLLLTQSAAVRTLIREARDDVIWNYVELFARHGEVAAQKWLLEQNEQTQGTEAAAVGGE